MWYKRQVFSRKIVAWQIYAEENGANASEVMRDLCRREQIAPGQLVLHSDNGGSMKGSTMLATLKALGVMASLSRPEYPLDPFVDIAAARTWASTLVHWYNHEHRHSAIRFVTPAQRHAGLDQAILAKRSALYEVARAKAPLRWKRSTRNWRRIDIVHLNPDQIDTQGNLKTEPPINLKMAA